MTDFNLNFDRDNGFVQMDGFHNGVGTNDEHEDIEVIENDRWDFLDEGSNDERKRRCVLKNLAKEKICSPGNVYKDYVLELQATNVDITVKIDVYSEHNPSNPTTRFKGIYIFLGPLKNDFKAGLKDLLIFIGANMKGFFLGRAISDILLNNICEVFNSKVMEKVKGPLTPTATTILDVNKSHASHYIARWNGGEKYQVTEAWQDQHVIDVRNNTYTCSKLELIGIPCKYVIATLYEMTKNSEGVGDIYMWVNKVY
ncbi:unnamed protein product [Lactuca saligna]|uniref:Uncharacterized protein n=1 Tax=Lactuca saligna TaxID=75948 RepID=A0AA36EPH5_LACSI|nr:unnamed protein product [Lactuca saligna]